MFVLTVFGFILFILKSSFRKGFGKEIKKKEEANSLLSA